MTEPDSARQAGRDLAKLGAKKGGRARASVLTASERQEIARRAVQARWAKAGKLKAISEQAEREDEAELPEDEQPKMPYSLFAGKLKIGDVEFECHVLNDHRRVLTQREVVRVISAGRESGNLTRYLQRNPLYRDDLLPGRTVRFQVPATVGEAKQQKEFTTLLRDLVARGRAAGIVVVAATQRPSADILPTSLRDLFGYRWAFRCSTDASSDVILGHG